MTRPPQHHICNEPKCGAKVNTAHKAKKHNAKTGHKMLVNWRAERAHLKYLARQNPSYLGLLNQRLSFGEALGVEE